MLSLRTQPVCLCPLLRPLIRRGFLFLQPPAEGQVLSVLHTWQPIGCACRASCMRSTTTSAGNRYRRSGDSAPDRPARAGGDGGTRPECSTRASRSARSAARHRRTRLVGSLCGCLPLPGEGGRPPARRRL